MKKLIVLIALIALFAVSATALSVTSPSLGGERQERASNVSTTFTITNNNSATISGISITPTVDAKYAVTFADVPSTLAAGASASVTIKAIVPLDHSAVDSLLAEAALNIGTFSVSGTVGSVVDSAVGNINVQAINRFEINKARIECDTISKSVDDGDRVEKLKPGMTCDIDVEIENTFDDEDSDGKRIGDVEFSDLEIEVESDDSDADVDVEDEPDDLGADEKDNIRIVAEIDEEAADGAITVTIAITARDENNALHGEKLSFKLDVERLTHDLQIRRIEVSPTRINACVDGNVRVSTSVLNQGKRDESSAAVSVKVEDLKFEKKVENIELDEDDSTIVAIDVPITKTTKPGVYRLVVGTFFDNLAPSQSGSAEFVVEKCDVEIEPEVVISTTETKVEPVASNVVTPSNQVQAQSAPVRSSSTNGYVAALAVLSIIILGLVIAGAVFLARRPKK